MEEIGRNKQIKLLKHYIGKYLRAFSDSDDAVPVSDISGITLENFKCFKNKIEVQLKPLTVLCGANSAGKSSLIQPLLLMKQTLNCAYDPGALLLRGPNIIVNDFDELCWKAKGEKSDYFNIGFKLTNGVEYMQTYSKQGRSISIPKVAVINKNGNELILPSDTPISDDQIKILLGTIPGKFRSSFDYYSRIAEQLDLDGPQLQASVSAKLSRRRCFSSLRLMNNKFTVGNVRLLDQFERQIKSIMHLPGHRGNPSREYDRGEIASTDFMGYFHKYYASFILEWTKHNKNKSVSNKMEKLRHQLRVLGIGWKVDARDIDSSRIEIRISRLFKPEASGAHDLVNIADVGFGVGQVLPVLVAMLAMTKGQILYVEQPEIHLHPKAQYELGRILSNAVDEGKILIVETHSDHILLGMQQEIASKNVDPTNISLNWFTKSEDGIASVTNGILDTKGRWRDWPEDFAANRMANQKLLLKSSLGIEK